MLQPRDRETLTAITPELAELSQEVLFGTCPALFVCPLSGH